MNPLDVDPWYWIRRGRCPACDVDISSGPHSPSCERPDIEIDLHGLSVIVMWGIGKPWPQGVPER